MFPSHDKVVSKVEELKFPVLMECTIDGLWFVAMFTTPNDGVVVGSRTIIHPVGEVFNGWIGARDSATWKKFTGKITLSND